MSNPVVLHMDTRNFRAFHIRPLFGGVTPGYFVQIAPEIPAELLDAMTPAPFWIAIHSEEPPKKHFESGMLRAITPEEALWTIGFMEVGFAGEVGERGIRFVHPPLFIDGFGMRQLAVRFNGTTGYIIETVLASEAPGQMRLAYAIGNEP